MYIKLTRLDNSPIWINAAFVVTVEPRRGGGTVVVPIGDGLDYEVRETPAAVLAMLEGTPAAAVVPVPAPRGLAPTPEDVSPETEPPDVVPSAPSAPGAPSAPPTAAAPSESAAATPSEREAAAPGDEPSVAAPDGEEPKPAKRTRRVKKAEADPAEPKPARKSRAKAKKPAVEFPDEQVERLKKMMPGSMRKLLNTLVTQFRVTDAGPVVAFLQERGVIDVDREHVIWK